MLLGAAVNGSTGAAVTLPNLIDGQFSRYGDYPIDVYVRAGIRFHQDGKIYFQEVSGIWQASGYSWLLNGTNSDYYLKRTHVSGDTLLVDSGDLQQMNANLDFYLQSTLADSFKGVVMTFGISDDSGGSNIIVEETYSWDAWLLS